MLHLDLDKLNCVVALTLPTNDGVDFEKHYIYTNDKGVEYFDEKMKVDNAALYDQVFLEEFLAGILYSLNKTWTSTFITYGEIPDEEVMKSQHKKIVMGFHCDRWETAHANFQKEKVIDFFKKNKPNVSLDNLSDIELFLHLKEYVVNIFNEYFNHNNVFVSVINKEEYQSLSSGSSNNFVFYLERVNLYEKLQSCEIKNNEIKNKKKI